MDELDRIRRDGELFLTELNEAYYLNYSGRRESLDLTSIYGRYGKLSDIHTFRYATEIMSSGVVNDLEAIKLQALRAFLAQEVLESKIQREIEAVIAREIETRLSVDGGEEVTFRASRLLLANTAHRPSRDAIERQIVAALTSINEILEKAFARMIDEAPNLDCGSYRALIGEVKGWDLEQLCRQARLFLDDTEEAYREVLAWYLSRKLGVGIADCQRHDLVHLFRAQDVDPLFPPDALVATAQRCLAEMGLNINDSIHLDLESRKNKRSRAFCAPVEIPGRVYLIILPQGGLDDYMAFFHELGHALHFSHIGSHLPFEFRYLGDDSLTEGYAMLLEHWVDNHNWLKRYLKVQADPDRLRFFALRKLFLLRRYCGKLLYEFDLYSHPVAEKRDLYAERLQEATLGHTPSAYYLHDVDFHFYCVAYLHAWILEEQLCSNLREKHDEEWYRAPEAGRELRELWAAGQSFCGETLSRRLGYDGLDMQVISRAILAKLDNPIQV